MRKPFVQAVLLIAIAFVLAVVSNAVASRDRRLVLPGYYPGALQVPKQQTAATATVTTPIAPVAPPIAPPTAPPVTTSSAEPTATAAQVKPAVAVTHTAAPKIETPKPAAAATAKEFAPHADKAYVEVDYADAAALRNQGALTLDARRTNIYEQGHIAGARPFSVWESDIDDKVNKLYEERNDPREQLKPILVYCSGGDCEDSHMLAQKLWGIQFNNVYVYKDGYPDWQKHNGPIHTGSNP
jgi:rhodanese-related sulfurtransferase